MTIRNNIVVKIEIELGLLFHKKTTQIVFFNSIWANYAQSVNIQVVTSIDIENKIYCASYKLLKNIFII